MTREYLIRVDTSDPLELAYSLVSLEQDGSIEILAVGTMEDREKFDAKINRMAKFYGATLIRLSKKSHSSLKQIRQQPYKKLSATLD